MKKSFVITLIFCFYTIVLNAQENAKRYEVKSGKMELTSEIFGKEQDMTMYFDNYGLVEYTETKGEIIGFKIHNIQIRKEGFIYTIDMNMKTCKKAPVDSAGTSQNINFSSMTQKMIDDLHISKTGTETYLDRVCDVWTMDHTEMRMKGTYLIWKGISLKTEMEASGMIIRMKTKSIDITSPLPNGIFDIPADVKMVDK